MCKLVCQLATASCEYVATFDYRTCNSVLPLVSDDRNDDMGF